jgi:hypothetical protein
MKNYNKFIIEDLSEDEIKEILHRDCEQFLYEGVILYRGMKLDIEDYQLFQRKHERTPSDMPVHIHQILDELFERLHGWKARSSGVFATGSFDDAKFYSKRLGFNGMVEFDPYIFVPKGEYEFLYNPAIGDLFPYIDESGYKNISEWYGIDNIDGGLSYWGDEHDERYKKIQQDYEKALNKFLEEIVEGYQDYDIVDAASYYNEIMFNCDEYYLFNIKYKDEIKKWF